MMKIDRSVSKRVVCGLAVIALLMTTSSNVSAQVLFTTALDDGTDWASRATGDTDITFGYDYSADGIPEAPNPSPAGALFLLTTGIKVEANQNLPAAAETLTIYPTGQYFTGNYQLRFDAWTNYDVDVRINSSASGTTEYIGGGLGYNGISTDSDSGAQIFVTNDEGASSDWRIEQDGALLAAASMDGGSRNGSAAYYTDFLPGVAPPANQSQVVTIPGAAGSPGFQWLTFEVTNTNEMVNFTVEKPDSSRLSVATVDCSGGACTTDGNISLFYGDLFPSVTSRPDLTFGLFDNVVVTAVTAGLDGDYNENGVVDAADYTLWLDNLGAAAGALPNDGDGGVIGQAQYDTWKANFGNSVAVGAGSSNGGAIPEPTSAVLFLIASVATVLARRRGN